MPAAAILVIDDNEAVRTAFDVLLSLHGARVLGAATPARAWTLLEREAVDLVIQDMNFRREATSGEEGIALFREIRAGFPDVPIILLTAWTHLETAVRAGERRRGGLHRQALGRRAPAHHRAQSARPAPRAARGGGACAARGRAARAALAERFDLRGIVYESDAMHTLVAMATQVAHADVPVLITGPNGAGKEVLADIVQANSAVRDRARTSR